MIASPAYKDIKVTSSGFTKNFGKSSNGAVDDSSSLSQQESVTKSTFRGLQEQKRGAECILCCCGGGGNTGVMLKEPLLTATLASEAVSALVKTYPKPGVVGAHTIPTLHKYGDGKFVERDQVEVCW